MKPSRVDALILLSAPSAATEGAFFLTECSTLLFFDTHGIHCKATMTPPIDSTAIYGKSLYEAEESGNKFETELIQAITGLPNIRWWHRNIARTGFAINGFINHYPDFIVRTRSGKIIIIETKGSTSSKSSPCSPVFAPSATNAQQNAHPRLNRGAGIDIMPCDRCTLNYDHPPLTKRQDCIQQC